MSRRPGPKPLPVSARFWIRVVKNGDCWEWTGCLNKTGYGQINLGKPRKLMLCHRLSWTLTRGEIPLGMGVLHKCDNPRCVNPDHLFLGTPKDNAQDMIRKYGHPANRGRSYMPKGKDHHFYEKGPKLTRKIAEKIRESKLRNSELAIKYNVHSSLISMIRSGKAWK